MIKLLEGGAYLLNGTEIVVDSSDALCEVKAKTGKDVSKEAAKQATIAYDILKEMGMDVKRRTEIMMAIGNHDEETGTAVSDISAALILADKSDVHRNRVVKQNPSTFDIHDRVNYAVTGANLKIDMEERIPTVCIVIVNEFYIIVHTVLTIPVFTN